MEELEEGARKSRECNHPTLNGDTHTKRISCPDCGMSEPITLN